MESQIQEMLISFLCLHSYHTRDDLKVSNIEMQGVKVSYEYQTMCMAFPETDTVDTLDLIAWAWSGL